MTCERCGRDTPDVRRREYSLPQVIDPASASPTPTGACDTRIIATCDDCDRQTRETGSEAQIWLEKRLGTPL
jgi:hypothetical protein